MYGKVKNIWDIKSNGGGSSIDTQNFASKIKANTFTQKNTFENTGNVINIKTTDTQAFGIAFKNNTDETVGYVGTKVDGNEQKAHLHGYLGLSLETPNKNININSGSGHILSNTTKNWNQHVDNSIVRYKDTKWVRIFENTSLSSQPNINWNWNWISGSFNGLVSQDGEIELMIVISWSDNNVNTLTTKLVWKNGIPTSKSNTFLVEKSERTYRFQIEIRQNNLLYIYAKHDNNGSGGTISWVRGYVKRGLGRPTKFEQLW